MQPWHRLLGLVFIDYFTGKPFTVETEVEVSVKSQLLDIVVLRKVDQPLYTDPLFDGFDNLADYNLITFKSYQQTFDAWTVRELIGYYVNYRKMISDTFPDLIPEERFRLFGITARFPEQFASQIPLHETLPGVYDFQWGLDRIRLLVINRMRPEQQNANVLVFSADQRRVEFGARNFQKQNPESTRLIDQLIALQLQEGVLPMPYTLEDFNRDYLTQLLGRLTPEQRRLLFSKGVPKDVLETIPVGVRLEGIPVKDVLENIPIEARLEGIPVEERLKDVPLKDRFKGLMPNEFLEENVLQELMKHIPPDKLEEVIRKLHFKPQS